jgi:hypothetical protein
VLLINANVELTRRRFPKERPAEPSVGRIVPKIPDNRGKRSKSTRQRSAVMSKKEQNGPERNISKIVRF